MKTASTMVYPRRAAGVRLHGEMRDVGFTTTQWLIERDGQFLQLSELLYRVLAELDGTRSTGEVAARVTAQSQWALEAEHVEHLLEKKLRPLGLIAVDDGTAVPSAPAAAGTPSPLRVNMKVMMLPARIVESLTRLLQYAYAPALLIPATILIGYAHWWMYARTSARASLEAALYVPGALGAVLLLAILAGLFHELGHSSALRYGGGTPRGIGFGFYLVFPVFYSDVTDNYRLRRGGRIRTDLGGIYFHFIFAAVLIGIAAATGSQFLLAAAVLFNVEAARQFIPLVRLDGYWLLADLTGVPDFLAQVRSFVASIRPARARAGIPQFKRWVTAVFALYVVLSVPATLYLLAAMVGYVPELWTLTRSAMLVQSELWSATAEPLTRALVIVQLAMIPLPLAAIVYFLYVTISALTTQIAARHGWIPTEVPVRRLAGATALAACAAFVAIAATPSASTANLTHGRRADIRLDGSALLRRVQDATSRIHTIEAELRGTLGDDRFTGMLALSRPNRADIKVLGSTSSLGTFTVKADGENVFVFFPEDNKYTQAKAVADGSNITAFIVDHVRTFFRPDRLAATGSEQVSYLGEERVEGTLYHVLEKTGTRDASSWRYYISAHDYLIHRVVVVHAENGKSTTRTSQLANLRLNRSLDEARFRWSPPSDATTLGFETLGLAVSLPGVK